MLDKTINTEVTMRDAAPAGGAKRFRAGDEILGRYVIESELGQGGMGVVYLCLDKVGGVKVAVKGLPPEVSHNSEEMEEVRRNFQLVCALRHPGIAGIRTLEREESSGLYYLVMDVAEGQNLTRWMREHDGPGLTPEKLTILRDIASALDYAHERRILHRDIKPGNVMVGPDGHAQVLDFGLAAQIRSSMSRVSLMVTSQSGTPAYKSPEQWKGRPQRAAADQYSLAVIAYKMISGELPFDGDDLTMLGRAVMNVAPEKVTGVPASVNAALQKALAKEPEGRFESCTAFVAALSSGGRARTLAAPLKWIAASVLLLSLAAVGGWWWERVKSEELRVKDEALAAEQARQERKAEEARIVAEKAEAERKAKEEAERKQEEAWIAAEKRKAEESQKIASALAAFEAKDFAKGWQLAAGIQDSDPRIQFFIGKCYANGYGGAESNVTEAVRWYRKAAERECAQAQLEVGLAYAYGRGVMKDMSEGVNWYKKAAEQGDGPAQAWLGLAYEGGYGGVTNDYVEAMKWYRRAAEQGNPYGQIYLANMYQRGKGVPQNDAEAVKWFRKAAEQGMGWSQYRLSEAYKSGKGVPKDDVMAAKWCLKAAEQDGEFLSGYAQCDLGMMYERGEGVAQNMTEAARWYRKAAEKGFYEAQYNLGRLFECGNGVPRNDVEAIKWYRKSAASGCEKAQDKLKSMEARGVDGKVEERTDPCRAPKAGDVKTITLPGGATMEFCWCPAGSFMMGSPESESERRSDETLHRVSLTKGFWMGKYEVTQRQWESVMGSNPSNFNGADRPVEMVSWDNCQNFVQKINAANQVVVALPTEAQWEYACRAGTTTPFNFGAVLNGDKANCNGNYPYGTTMKGRYREGTTSVGSYAPNAWGLYDMHGNVYEWCADWYDKDYYSRSPLEDPTGPELGARRVNRGGRFSGEAFYCRSACRFNGCEPSSRACFFGLRLVCFEGPRREKAETERIAEGKRNPDGNGGVSRKPETDLTKQDAKEQKRAALVDRTCSELASDGKDVFLGLKSIDASRMDFRINANLAPGCYSLMARRKNKDDKSSALARHKVEIVGAR